MAVRERRLIMAALQQREPLAQEHRETPPRAAITDMSLRSRGRVPRLFEEGYSSYIESLQAVEDGTEEQLGDEEQQALGAGGIPSPGKSSPGESGAAAATPRPRRLRVLPWHREAMQQMLCRGVFFQFLQDRRQALGLRTGEHPLWFWEARRAQEYTAAGQVAVLVKYLAETELHIAQGPQRRESPPGSMPLAKASERLRAERRQLVKQWEASGERISSRTLHEDAFFRVFLDGQLSWPRVKKMMGFMVPAEAPDSQLQE